MAKVGAATTGLPSAGSSAAGSSAGSCGSAGGAYSAYSMYSFGSNKGTTTTPSGKSTGAQQKQIPRLNQLDLQALFRRLDVSGDGSLSFSEFRNIVTKLNLTSPSVIDCIHDVYKAADTNPGGGGSLSLVEFMKAYDILYNRLVNDTGINKEVDPYANFVRATRYGYFGRDGIDKKYIFECYTGSMSNISTKFVYDLPNVENNENEEEIVVGPPIDVSDIPFTTVDLKNYNIETINRLILEDSHRNLQYDARMMWWVDICSRNMKESEISSAMNAFGIPAAVRDNLSDFEENQRVHFGEGEVVCETIGKSIAPGNYIGKASMLSFFVQAMYLKNKSVVDRDSEFVRSIPFELGEYFNSRMALFYNYAGVPDTERDKVISLVDKDIGCLLDQPAEERKLKTAELPLGGVESGGGGGSSGGDSGETLHHHALHLPLPLPLLHHHQEEQQQRDPAKTVTSSHQTSLPVGKVVEMRGDSFLLSQSDMKKRPSEIVRENVSLHIQDQGNGPIALITLRRFDSNEKEFDLDQNSRKGIVGRIMSGVWLKLLEVTANEGVVNKASDLDDSSFSLAITIISLLHNTSMLTTQSLDLWVKQLATEIAEVAVTKHAKHIEHLEQHFAELRSYVGTFNSTFAPIIEAYFKSQGDEDAIVLVKKISTSASTSASSRGLFTNNGNSRGPTIQRPVSARAGKGIDVTHLPVHKPLFVSEIHMNALDNPHRTDGNEVLKAGAAYKSIYPYEMVFNFNKTSKEQKFQIFKDFACNDTLRRLPELLKGVEALELKGGMYWLDRIEALEDYLEIVNTRYRLGLDEKRNFWAFTLGIVSIATFPFAVMTGYFGMNFENMTNPNGGVLTDNYWPMFPGQDLIWILTLIVYSLMGAVAMHYQVFYSAT